MTTIKLGADEFAFIIKRGKEPDSIGFRFEHGPASNTLNMPITAATILKSYIASDLFVSHVKAVYELAMRKAGMLDDDGG
jgi:hypothetical protein